MKIKLTKKQLTELEDFIKDEVEAILFSTERPRAKVTGYKTVTKKGKVIERTPILGGSHYIEDKSGNLRQTLRNAKNFIKQTDKGLTINLEMAPYFKYLDDERKKKEFNWYISAEVFNSDIIRDKIREMMSIAAKNAVVNLISKETKDI